MPRGLYFSKALFKGLICGGNYTQWVIYVTKSIELAYSWKANKRIMCYRTGFCFLAFLYLSAIFKCKPMRAYFRKGDLTAAFLRYEFGGGGLIFGRA